MKVGAKMSLRIRQTVFPLLAAMIWGAAFVFQSVTTDIIGPLTFTASRASVAVFALLPVIFAFRVSKKRQGTKVEKTDFKHLLKAGVFCGVFLTIGATLQQAGLGYTSAGKAAFITALYIVIVPVCGVFFGSKPTAKMWVSVAVAVGGLYFLSVQPGEFSIAVGDLILLACAFGFSGQILMIDHFAPKCDPIELCCMQFAVEAVLCWLGAFILENPSLHAIWACMGSILYVGIFSSAVAFTLQIVAQKDGDPTLVSIILSLESFFGAVAGAVLLHEAMSGREMFGCALMMGATILSQIPERTKTGLKV